MKIKMKKIKQNVLLVLTVALLFLLLGCAKNNIVETVDYSEYSFTDISWTREAEHDIETIRFGSDGSFVYYCACGNPNRLQDFHRHNSRQMIHQSQTLWFQYHALPLLSMRCP